MTVVRPDGYSSFPDSPSSMTIMKLCWCVPACAFCFVTRVCVRSFPSHRGAIWDAEAPSLSVPASASSRPPQGESVCHDGRAAVVVLKPFSSSFYHRTLSLKHRMEELAHVSACSHSYLLVLHPNCCFPLRHLWNQNTEVPGLMHRPTQKSTHTHFETPSLCCWLEFGALMCCSYHTCSPTRLFLVPYWVPLIIIQEDAWVVLLLPVADFLTGPL